MARLKKDANIILHDPISGNRVVFEGGDDLPPWATKLIADDAGILEDTPAKKAEPKTDTSVDGGGADAGGSDNGGGSEGGSDVVPEEPPRSGKGSGAAAWKTYAAAIGLELPDDATTTAKIIAAVDAAKG